jgi:tryptophanyl-tRNA synthetase
VQQTGLDMVIDWLAAGVDPNQATLFVQSQVLEHAELHLLLSMITPLGWLERVPTYKDQQEKLAGQGPLHLRLPRLSPAAGGRHPDLSRALRAGGRRPGAAPRISRARSHGASITCTGREPGFEDKAKDRGQETRHQKGPSAERVAHQIPGERRQPRRSPAARRCSMSSRTCRAAIESECTAGWKAAAARSWSSPRRC